MCYCNCFHIYNFQALYKDMTGYLTIINIQDTFIQSDTKKTEISVIYEPKV